MAPDERSASRPQPDLGPQPISLEQYESFTPEKLELAGRPAKKR